MAKIMEEEITVADFFEVAEEVANARGVVVVPVLMRVGDEIVPIYIQLLPDQIRAVRNQLLKATSSGEVGLSFDITPGSVKEMRDQLPDTDSNDIHLHDPDTST